MEFEQLIKRLDWLDEEHRKNAASLENAKEKLDGLESENKILRKRIKELTNEMSRMVTAAGRMEEYDTALTHYRKEITTFIKGSEKRHEANQVEVEKRYRLEFDGQNKILAELKASVAGFKRGLKEITDENVHQKRTISEALVKIETLLRANEEIHQSIQEDENRRMDRKHIEDLLGENSSMRKRMDEIRQKINSLAEGLRHAEIRLTEIATGESDRRQSQTAFIETQAHLQLERDRTWKEWQERFDTLSKQTDSIDLQLQNWDAARLMLKRAQETYEEITTKFERRINEITEIQRLGEDRYRQEWVAFRADDQKRWSSFTVSQDETRKDIHAENSKLEERITGLEDLTQTLQDIIQQTRDADEQMLQALLAQVHELLSTYDRIKGTA